MTEIEGATWVQMGLNDNGCGHRILLSDEHYKSCKENHRTWYCTICGSARQFVGKTTVDQLRGDLAAAKQREETERHLRVQAEAARDAATLAAKQLRKRVKNGVCPCCTRSFENLREHIKTKHPEYEKAKASKPPKAKSRYVAERLAELEKKP